MTNSIINNKTTYESKLNSLNLSRVELVKVEDKETHRVLTIYGGFNGNGDWLTYLTQIRSIIETFDAWIVDLNNDCLDDVWTLRIGTNM